MHFIKLNIPPAGSWKRDCELTDFKLLPILSFEFTKESDQTKWKLIFNDYFSIKITTEEFIIHLTEKGVPDQGSFYIVKNSPWIDDLLHTNSQLLVEANHYLFFFYDEVIEVIAGELKYDKIH